MSAQVVPDWRDAAACRDVDPNLFFPEEGRVKDSEAAKKVCGCTRCAASPWAPADGA